MYVRNMKQKRLYFEYIYKCSSGFPLNIGQTESNVSRSLITDKRARIVAHLPIGNGAVWQGPMKMVASRRLTLMLASFDPRNTAFQFTTKPPILCVIFESAANCSLADVVPSHSSINRSVQQLTRISMRFHAPASKDPREIYCFDLLCSLYILISVCFTSFSSLFFFSLSFSMRGWLGMESSLIRNLEILNTISIFSFGSFVSFCSFERYSKLQQCFNDYIHST